MASQDLVMHNPNQPDSFGYQVAFVKVKEDGTESSYSITQYASEINVYESMFAKACQCQVGVFDGGGLLETLALQPGDYIDITLLKDEDSAKVIKRFVILNIGNVQRAQNSSAKTYTVSGITLPAFKNKQHTVYRGFKGKHSDMITTICQDYLGIANVEIEATVGDFTVVTPGKTPFKIISQIMLHSISAEGGEDASLYFFYEDRDGHKFKSLHKVVADANTHGYQVSVDKNADGPQDLAKIQHFVQLKAGSHSERMSSGMYENEVMEFDPITRSITSKKWTFEEKGKGLQLLGPNAVMDTANNLKQWVSDGESKIRGLANMVKIRVADEAYEQVNNLSRKFGSMQAQKAMFNQLIYAVQIFGNPDIKAGDLINVTAPAMAMSSTPEMDFSLQGRFLVGDVRHRVINGEQFITILNIFKDGYETEYTQESEK